MGNSPSLIDLDLTKPVTTLIEKVSDAIGIVYEPTQIVKKAKAEVEADKIRALGKLELNNLEERAMKRFIHQESRKQQNIESILSQTIKLLPSDAKVEDLDPDWLAYFFKSCSDISDEDMQMIWARLLSGEATKSGSFSKRTVTFISTMDKSDAEIFIKLCQFCVIINDEPHPIVYDIRSKIYKDQISFNELIHLSTIGLITHNFNTGYVLVLSSEIKNCKYFTKYFSFSAKDNSQDIGIGDVLFTQIASELFSICTPNYNEEFYPYLLRVMRDKGAILCSKYPRNE